MGPRITWRGAEENRFVPIKISLKVDISKDYDELDRALFRRGGVPYLFVLAIEALSSELEKITILKLFSPTPHKGPHQIMHLIFADNEFIFRKVDPKTLAT